MSARDSVMYVGRPWLHCPLFGVASICRKSAFISASVSRRPARTLPWQASVAQTRSSASRRLTRLIDLGEILDQIANQLRHVRIAERRGQLAHEHRALAERLEHQAEALELLAPLQQEFDMRGIEVDHLGQQQALARHPARDESRLHALVDQALVGGVLVDQDQARLRLRHDVAVVQLRARGAERIALQRDIVECGRAVDSGCGRSDIETLRAEGRLIGRRTLREPARDPRARRPAAGAERAERRRAQRCSMDGSPPRRADLGSRRSPGRAPCLAGESAPQPWSDAR